jgi:nucleoside-diphosphate-sugar epimerase
MRIFLAGATGVIGVRLVPLLIAEGHSVAGMTRSADKTEQLADLGAQPVVCDVFDLPALTKAVTAFEPEAILQEITDLPDSLDELGDYAARNDRIRTEGGATWSPRLAPQARTIFLRSAWRPAGRGGAVDDLERQVLDVDGVVVRYGQLYGPGTFYEDRLPQHPRIHVDEAARGTPPLIAAPSGVVSLVEQQ